MKIAIVSGKGGTGKSSITAAFIALSPKVIAIDSDVDASNLPLLFEHEIKEKEPFVSGNHVVIDHELCTQCGMCVDHCAYHSISLENAKIEVNQVLCEGCGLCQHLCPQQAITLVNEAKSVIYQSHFEHGVLVHGHLNPGDDNSGKMVARIRTIADQQQEKENIALQLLDGPPGIGCPVLSTITGMDRVIIVCEPTQSGISDLKRIYQVTLSFCRNMLVIINKCNINKQEYKAIRHFCKCLKLPILAELPFDRKMVEAQVNKETIITYAPQSPCALSLKEAYKRMLK